MNIETLNNFIIICELGSINKAAHALHISQPPLTKQIQNLEKELNATLFERLSSGIKLTQEGQILYERAKTILSYKDLATREIEMCNHIVRFGMTTSSVKYAINVLKNYKNESIYFDIHERNTFQLIEELNNDTIEFAFIRTPFEDVKDFIKIKLTSDNIVLIGKEEFFTDVKGDTVDSSWLIDKPIIANRRWKDFITIEKNGKKVFLSHKYLCDDNRTAQTMAKEGLGIAILPSSELIEMPKELISKHIDSNKYNTSIYLVYKSGQVFNRYTRKIIDYITRNGEK